jgi:prephenate dehydratase
LVTTFVFRVRNVPAALYKALGGFATNGVNMTKLESYMVEGEFAATQFLADVDTFDCGAAFLQALGNRMDYTARRRSGFGGDNRRSFRGFPRSLFG